MATELTLICATCKKEFKKPLSKVRPYQRAGKENSYCCMDCYRKRPKSKRKEWVY